MTKQKTDRLIKLRLLRRNIYIAKDGASNPIGVIAAFNKEQAEIYFQGTGLPAMFIEEIILSKLRTNVSPLVQFEERTIRIGIDTRTVIVAKKRVG